MSYIWLFLTFFMCSTNAQSGWTVQNFQTNLELDDIYFVNNETGYIVGGSSDTCLILKTVNSGSNWLVNYSEADRGLTTITFLDENTGFTAGAWGIYFRTSNGGAVWIKGSITTNTIFSLVFTDRNTGYASGKWNTIQKTTDGGINWYSLVTGGGPMHQDMDFVNNDIGFIVSENGNVLKTTNGGSNWISITVDEDAILYSIFFVNDYLGFCGGKKSGIAYIARTSNGGSNWNEINLDTVGCIYTIYFVNQQLGYISGYQNILKTTNSGFNWRIQNYIHYSEIFDIFFTNPSIGYAVGYDYENNKGLILKTTTGGEPIGIKPISTSVPKSFSLSQNYPNPFNPSTKIKFSIPPLKGVRGMSGVVTLKIYDLLGREVATLVNERLEAGTYEVNWDSSNYPSGVYFYKLMVSGADGQLYMETKKMILLK